MSHPSIDIDTRATRSFATGRFVVASYITCDAPIDFPIPTIDMLVERLGQMYDGTKPIPPRNACRRIRIPLPNIFARTSNLRRHRCKIRAQFNGRKLPVRTRISRYQEHRNSPTSRPPRPCGLGVSRHYEEDHSSTTSAKKVRNNYVRGTHVADELQRLAMK